jgi:hypothetical protein
MLCLGPLALTSAARADCAQWNVPAGYSLNQANGYRVKLLSGLSGNAQYWPVTTRSPIVNGDVFGGLITAKKISFKIHWQNGATGSYDGNVSTNGHVQGTTRDQRTGASAGFVGGTLKCAAAPPPPAQSSGAKKPRPAIITRQPDVIRKPDGDVR